MGRSGSVVTLVQCCSGSAEQPEIRLDDLIVDEYRLADYHKQFAVVAQSISVGDTIRNNLYRETRDAS